MSTQAFFLALPVLGEFANLEKFFTRIENQSCTNFFIYVCVNQYESWWDNDDKVHYCEDNKKSLEYLKSLKRDNLVIIDKSSRGRGWPEKKGGVGWARKLLMDKIVEDHGQGVIVSMDADTYYPENYLETIQQYFVSNPEKTGLSIPYYHHLSDDKTDRLILRYETYMRYYAINMLRIDNPYNFTALGSALAIPLWAYRKTGGMTPVRSGEDFYLLQKLVKTGPLGQWVNTTAYPSSRFSDRVLFGTGPALIKGTKNDWRSYPLYPAFLFDQIKETFDSFPELRHREFNTPMTSFLQNQLGTDNLWDPLRKNYKDKINFVKACESKVDGLRILQFLKSSYPPNNRKRDEAVLKDFLLRNFPDELDAQLTAVVDHLDYRDTEIKELDLIRNLLCNLEMKLRKSRENS